MIAVPHPGLQAAMPVQAVWSIAWAFRRTCADRKKADRCSPTVGMTSGWHRLDSRTEPVVAHSMMFEWAGMLENLALPAIAKFGVGAMLALRDQR